MLLNPLTFHAPTTVGEAVSLYTSLESAKLQAGGTFLLNSLKLLKRKGSKTPENVISLGKIDELKGVSVEGGQLVIKAMTTITDLGESPHLTDNVEIFKLVCKNISTTPIRNMATVGGNLTCRYTWTEMPAVMIGLNAQLHFAAADGKTETLSAEEFFAHAAKTKNLFTHVTIPINSKATVAYQRIKKTPNVDIPMLSLLIQTVFEGNKFTNTTVGINNCVAFAQRDRKLEDFLNASTCSETIAEEALDHMDNEIYDNRSTDYKKHMFRVSIKSAIQQLVNKHTIYDKA